MKPLDIYHSPFIKEDTEVYIVGQFLDGLDTDNEGLEKQTRVKVRTHFNPYIDGTRHASLRSVWFDNHPVMITKSGGRPDSEYSHRYITDLPRYKEMVSYLKSLEELEEWRVEEELFSADEEVEGLDKVYTFQVEVSDFGATANARQWFRKFLREWGANHSWPYPSSFPWWKWDDPATHRQPTLEERQQVRNELLAAQPEDFRAVADVLEQMNDKGLVVVMGSKEAIDEANAARNDWLRILKVL